VGHAPGDLRGEPQPPRLVVDLVEELAGFAQDLLGAGVRGGGLASARRGLEQRVGPLDALQDLVHAPQSAACGATTKATGHPYRAARRAASIRPLARGTSGGPAPSRGIGDAMVLLLASVAPLFTRCCASTAARTPWSGTPGTTRS